MSLTIKEVTTKSALSKWVQFPNILYGDNEYYVPFLKMDEMATFTSTKNPAYEFCDTKHFAAYQGGKMVGRIAGIINHAYNKKWNKNAGRTPLGLFKVKCEGKLHACATTPDEQKSNELKKEAHIAGITRFWQGDKTAKTQEYFFQGTAEIVENLNEYTANGKS